jgi:hypothetical protein
MNVWLNDRFGFGKVNMKEPILMATEPKHFSGLGHRWRIFTVLDRLKLLTSPSGAVSQALTYAIQSPAPPFPVMILANILAGFGMALQVRYPVYIEPNVFLIFCMTRMRKPMALLVV